MHENEIEITKENYDELFLDASYRGEQYVSAFKEQVERQRFWQSIAPIDTPTQEDIDWAKKLGKSLE